MAQDVAVNVTHAVPETTVMVAVDAETGQVTVQQIATYVLAGSPLSRCNLLKGLHESEGETKAALPLPLEDVLAWDGFVLSEYMDPAHPSPADLVQWFQVLPRLTCRGMERMYEVAVHVHEHALATHLHASGLAAPMYRL
jgi:hypothetical protein